MEEAERAEQEAAAEITRAQEVVDRTARARGSVAAATPPPPARVQSDHSRSERPGDDVFLDGSVTSMASPGRLVFSAKLTAAVVAKASALMTSVWRTSLHPPELLSHRQAWTKYTFSRRTYPVLVFNVFGVLAPPCVDSRNTRHRTPLFFPMPA